MIHALQNENPQIAQITRHEIGDDLPATILQSFVAAGKPRQEELDSAGSIALRDHVFAGAHLAHVIAAVEDGLGFFRRQRSEIRQFAQQRIIHGDPRCRYHLPLFPQLAGSPRRRWHPSVRRPEGPRRGRRSPPEFVSRTGRRPARSIAHRVPRHRGAEAPAGGRRSTPRSEPPQSFVWGPALYARPSTRSPRSSRSSGDQKWSRPLAGLAEP